MSATSGGQEVPLDLVSGRCRRTVQHTLGLLQFPPITLKVTTKKKTSWAEDLRSLSTWGEHLRYVRTKRQLSQKEVAQMFGINVSTVASWELKRNVPQTHFLPKIIEFLGYVPYSLQPYQGTLGATIAAARQLKGWSQPQFMKLLKTTSFTLLRWESDRNWPLAANIKKLEALLEVSLARFKRQRPQTNPTKNQHAPIRHPYCE